MKRCPRCNTEYEENQNKCPYCGYNPQKEDFSLYWFLFSFKGRIGRSEYLWYIFFEFMTFIVVVSISASMKMTEDEARFFYSIVSLLFILPNLATTAKRAHDFDYSAWYSMIVFVPYLGFILMIITGFIKGNPQENKYGLPVDKKKL